MLSAVCRDHSAKDVHYADTIPLTEELTRRQLWRPDGIHWGEAGNRLIAERLVQALRDGGFLERGRSADRTALQSDEFQFGRPQVLPPLPRGDRGECIRAAKDFPQPLLSEEEAKKCDHFPGKERGLMMTRSWQRVLRMTGYAVLACSLPAALACFVSYRQDQDFLGEMARRIVAGETTPAARVLALSNSIHRDQATHKNGSFFAVRRWGPTSRQVFVHGGDCADKSRLLCALLRELDISATPVMCFDPQTGLPTHTIVETDLGDGSRMIVDPTYDLYFPKPNAAGFYDLLDLRRDPDILANRIAELCASAPPARRG